jgi:hypothetical protein
MFRKRDETTERIRPMMNGAYPVQFEVDYPDRPLNRLTTAFRLIVAIPIAIVLGAVSGGSWEWSRNGNDARATVVAAGGFLFFATLLMIVFRQKYPRWWFDWNLELLRFTNRVSIYLALMDDRYPSTDEHQSVHLDVEYPDAQRLVRWLPVVKWLLAIPHYIVLFFLGIGAVVAVIVAWFAILFTGRYPRDLFEFLVGVHRWWNRVVAYALILTTDEYPPFRLGP